LRIGIATVTGHRRDPRRHFDTASKIRIPDDAAVCGLVGADVDHRRPPATFGAVWKTHSKIAI
jgi:hypothetical protein